jgi:hypothetical protein
MFNSILGSVRLSLEHLCNFTLHNELGSSSYIMGRVNNNNTLAWKNLFFLLGSFGRILRQFGDDLYSLLHNVDGGFCISFGQPLLVVQDSVGVEVVGENRSVVTKGAGETFRRLGFRNNKLFLNLGNFDNGVRFLVFFIVNLTRDSKTKGTSSFSGQTGPTFAAGLALLQLTTAMLLCLGTRTSTSSDPITSFLNFPIPALF